MSWLQELTDELTRRGVRGADRRRIVSELHDHIACEPGCEERLGDPAALADVFANELATARTRRSALAAFGALAAVAAVLAYSQLALAALGYPGFDHGHSQLLFWPALFGMFVAPQAALVAGTLAALRAYRRRGARSMPAAELALIRRRARVALISGALVVAGIELYVINFSSRLAAWWLVSVAILAALSGLGLLAAWRAASSAGTIVADMPGRAGDVFDDVPVLGAAWLRAHPWALGAAASLAVGLLMAAFEAHAEHSVIEGVQRGVVEGLAAAAGFALLGRALGVARRRHGAESHPEAG